MIQGGSKPGGSGTTGGLKGSSSASFPFSPNVRASSPLNGPVTVSTSIHSCQRSNSRDIGFLAQDAALTPSVLERLLAFVLSVERLLVSP